jgi:hypothetical protein
MKTHILLEQQVNQFSLDLMDLFFFILSVSKGNRISCQRCKYNRCVLSNIQKANIDPDQAVAASDFFTPGFLVFNQHTFAVAKCYGNSEGQLSA